MPDIAPIKIETKIGDDGVKALADLAKSSGSTFVGFCASALDQIIPQRRIWAFNNYAKVIDYYDAENAKRKEAGKRPISPRFAHPAFEVIGDESDDDMLSLWARLMSNLQDGGTDTQENRAFIGILQSMEPIDARILKWLCDIQRDDGTNPFICVDAQQAIGELNLTRRTLLLSLHNLSRLGTVNTVGLSDTSENIIVNKPKNNGLLPGLAVVMFETMYFRLTTLGTTLIDACRTADDCPTFSSQKSI